MIELTLDSVRNMARQVVEEVGPDYTYKNAHPEWLSPTEVEAMNYEVPEGAVTGCKYVVDGKPACIVGVILHRMGVTIPQLEHVENSGAAVALRELVKDGVVTAQPHIAAYLMNMQDMQDDDHAWADAYRRAEGRLS